MKFKVHTIDVNFLGYARSIAVYLIETPQGLILIETGPHSTFENLKYSLSKLGFNWRDIYHVFITHIHLDHAGAAWCFAQNGANIYLHPLGYKHLNDPSKLLSSAQRIYGEMMDRLWGTLKPIEGDLLVQVDDNTIINVYDIDIKALHTPGHAIHHIAWAVDGCLFAGDVAGVRIGQGPAVPPCPPPDIDVEAWRRSLDKLKNEKLLHTFYLTHFGVYRDIENHLEDLESLLMEYANFIKEYMSKDIDNDKLIHLFNNHVEKLLLESGCDQSQLNAYNSANPAYMSVAGLKRYWKKKLNL